MATLGKTVTGDYVHLKHTKSKVSSKVGKPRNWGRKEWQRMGFRSYIEWFQMRNRIWRTIWKERESA